MRKKQTERATTETETRGFKRKDRLDVVEHQARP